MANIPYDLYEILERKLGKEEAKEVAKLIEKSLEKIEEKAKEEKEIVKIQIKEELKEELLTKGEFYAEIKRLEEKITKLEKTLDLKIRIWFILVIALILFTNKGTLEWLLKLLGLIK